MKIQKQAFTLVELIVVITILAILWTIAFISLQWYSTQARDSTRLSDISTMKTSLELFHLWAWKYPQPTDGVAITYSWWTVWTQWTFGNSVFINVDKLDKIPTDPLTDKKYTYSVTTNEYELAWMLEWDPLTFNPYMLDGAFAWTVEATAIVEWNYNWLMWKSLTWASTCYALALPTIVANDVSNPDLLQIMANERLVYNGYNNLPAEYSTTKFNNEWWFAFGPWIPLVAYTDNASCWPLTDATDSTARLALVDWLQTAYTSTILEWEWEVANVVNLTVPEKETYAATFVNNNLGWKIEIVSWWELVESFTCWTSTVSAWSETYTTIEVDGNCWTSQNMRHWTKILNTDPIQSDNGIIEKWCYDDLDENCTSDWWLYTYNEAMWYWATEDEDISISVCGQLWDWWKLPTDTQVTDLTLGWATWWTWNKLSWIISNLPGFRYTNLSFYDRGSKGLWWTSTEIDATNAKNRRLVSFSFTVESISYNKNIGFAVVCIKN